MEEERAAAGEELDVIRMAIQEEELRQGEASWYLHAARKELEAWVKSALVASAMWFQVWIHVVSQRALGVDVCPLHLVDDTIFGASH